MRKVAVLLVICSIFFISIVSQAAAQNLTDSQQTFVDAFVYHIEGKCPCPEEVEKYTAFTKCVQSQYNNRIQKLNFGNGTTSPIKYLGFKSAKIVKEAIEDVLEISKSACESNVFGGGNNNDDEDDDGDEDEE